MTTDPQEHTSQGLIDLLEQAHRYALGLRRFCGTRGAGALYAVVVVALDSAMVFAQQARTLQQNQQSQPESES